MPLFGGRALCPCVFEKKAGWTPGTMANAEPRGPAHPFRTRAGGGSDRPSAAPPTDAAVASSRRGGSSTAEDAPRRRGPISRARTAPAENTCAHPPRARSLSEGLHDVVVVSRCSSGAHRGGVECASHPPPPPDKARPPLPRPPHPPLIGIAPYPRPSCLPPPPPIPFLREAENPPRDAVSE